MLDRERERKRQGTIYLSAESLCIESTKLNQYIKAARQRLVTTGVLVVAPEVIYTHAYRHTHTGHLNTAILRHLDL